MCKIELLISSTSNVPNWLFWQKYLNFLRVRLLLWIACKRAIWFHTQSIVSIICNLKLYPQVLHGESPRVPALWCPAHPSETTTCCLPTAQGVPAPWGRPHAPRHGHPLPPGETPPLAVLVRPHRHHPWGARTTLHRLVEVLSLGLLVGGKLRKMSRCGRTCTCCTDNHVLEEITSIGL